MLERGDQKLVRQPTAVRSERDEPIAFEDQPLARGALAAVGPDRECLGRRELLMALAKGAGKELVLGRRVGLSSGVRSRSPRPTRCDDHPLTGDRVLPELSWRQLEAPPPFFFSMNGVSKSIGAGQTIVVDCEEP